VTGKETMKPETLIIFDYSGTLSIEAVRFADEEPLVETLRETGLDALGIATADIFWRDIVNPTWAEGSLTSVGYASLMARRIREVFDPTVSQKTIADRTRDFVQRYFASSVVDRRWCPLITDLLGDPAVSVVVATDHYAEATDAVCRHLAACGVAGRAAAKSETPVDGQSIVVANSADMGSYKSQHVFWETIRTWYPLDEVCRIIAVDDFGFNESMGDAYAAAEKVATRTVETATVLTDVFGCLVDVVPFVAMAYDGVAPKEQLPSVEDVIAQVRGLWDGSYESRHCV